MKSNPYDAGLYAKAALCLAALVLILWGLL